MTTHASPEPAHPPFSVRASARETLAFVAALAAMVGAFGPWFRATRVEEPVLGEPVAREVALHAAGAAPWLVALACAFALALGLAPFRPAKKHAARAALFLLAALGVLVAAALGPFGPVFGWSGIFERYEDVRPAWGLALSLGGTLAAGLLVLSRLRERAAPTPVAAEA